MAFPTSPVDGQIYGKYIYNSTISTWENNLEDFSHNIRVSGLTVGSGAGNGILFEDGLHSIATNDGHNFSIRIGNGKNENGDVISTEDTYAGKMYYSQTTGTWRIATSITSAVVGDLLTFAFPITISKDGVGIYTTPNTNAYYGLNVSTHVDMNNHAINYATQFHLKDNGSGDFRMTTAAGGLPGYPTDNYPTIKASGGAMYFSVGGSYSAYMYASGAWTSRSSRDKKHNFVDITYEDYLGKMSNIDVQQYEYLDEIMEENQIYIGPYAEDMYREFGLGSGDMLSDKDTAGVALLGVKHLLNKLKTLKTRLLELESGGN